MRLLVLFSLALFGFSIGQDTDYKKYREEIKTALEKLVEIVEENDMNVTVIMTHIDRWSTDKVKEVSEQSLHLPTNNVQKTESKITEENIQDWIKTIKDLSEETKVTAHARIARIKDGKTGDIERIPTPDDNAFETKLYKTETSVEFDKKGFVVENPSYQKYYNVYVPGTDGKDERIEIIVGHVDTEVLKKSESMSDDEVKEIQQKMKEIFYKHNCRKVMGRVLKDHMNNKFENNDWQVIVDPGEEFYVPAKKYAAVRVVDTEVLVYSI